jgi:hypothetical protein
MTAGNAGAAGTIEDLLYDSRYYTGKAIVKVGLALGRAEEP